MKQRNKDLLKENALSLVSDKEKLLKYLPQDLLRNKTLDVQNKLMQKKIQLGLKRGFEDFNPDKFNKRIERLVIEFPDMARKQKEIHDSVVERLAERCDSRYHAKKYEKLQSDNYFETDFDVNIGIKTEEKVMETKYSTRPTEQTSDKWNKSHSKRMQYVSKPEKTVSKQLEFERMLIEKMTDELDTHNVNKYIDTFASFDRYFIRRRTKRERCGNSFSSD